MTTPSRSPQPFVQTRLGAMMFLQFFVWGAWYVTVGNYMARVGMADAIFWAYTVGPIAAIVSPFFLGMVADRFFATERVLGVMHLLGGAAMLAAPLVASGPDPSAPLFVGLLAVHMLCYMPTLGLTNTLAFHNMADQERQFPLIRVFGTIGWIVAGMFVSRVLRADEKALPLQVAGAAGLVLGLFSFTLPHTPPPARGRPFSVRDVLGLDALALLRSRAFAVFLVCSMLVCIPLAGYYSYAGVFVNHAGFHSPAFSMSFGQVSEVFFMLVMPLCFARLGVKWMLAVGMLAWVVRYALFAGAADAGVAWMILGGILLHGICYDFFFVTGQVYVDKRAPATIRGQAQGLLVLATQGIGLGVGAQVFGYLVNSRKSADADALAAQAAALRAQHAALVEAAGGPTAEATAKWDQASSLLLQTYEWGTIWLVPCVMALAILVVFVAMFRRESPSATPGPGASAP